MKENTKGVTIGVRVQTDMAEQFSRAAKAANKKISEWLRDLGAEAIAPPKAFAPKVFVAPVNPEEAVQVGQLRTAAEVAASIPGVRLGLVESVDVGDAPTEDMKARPWLPELRRLQQMGESDPNSAAEEFNTLLRGEQFRGPKGFLQWPIEKRAAWLDQNKPLVEEDGW